MQRGPLLLRCCSGGHAATAGARRAVDAPSTCRSTGAGWPRCLAMRPHPRRACCWRPWATWAGLQRCNARAPGRRETRRRCARPACAAQPPGEYMQAPRGQRHAKRLTRRATRMQRASPPARRSRRGIAGQNLRHEAELREAVCELGGGPDRVHGVTLGIVNDEARSNLRRRARSARERLRQCAGGNGGWDNVAKGSPPPVAVLGQQVEVGERERSRFLDALSPEVLRRAHVDELDVYVRGQDRVQDVRGRKHEHARVLVIPHGADIVFGTSPLRRLRTATKCVAHPVRRHRRGALSERCRARATELGTTGLQIDYHVGRDCDKKTRLLASRPHDTKKNGFA